MVFLIVLPSMNGFTFSEFFAAVSKSACVGVHGNLDDRRAACRVLPCTGISTSRFPHEQRRRQTSATARKASDGARGLPKRGVQPRPEFFREVMRRERREQLQKRFSSRTTASSAIVIASLMKTIIAEIAVLKRSPSRSSVTFLMHACSVFNCAGVAAIHFAMPPSSRIRFSNSW